MADGNNTNKFFMAKYSKTAQESVSAAMKRMEKGTLRSGRSGKKVTNPKQAIAIGLSGAKEKGAKVPKKKTTTKMAQKKGAARKTVTKKATPKKANTKGPAKKKSSAKKTAAPEKAVPLRKKNILKAKAAISDKKLTVKKHQQTAPDKTADADQNGLSFPPVEEKSPVTNPLTQKRITDPMAVTDKDALAKAVTKYDRRHIIKLSGPKTSIRPSGKKPLWR